jgi:hypothetical protein
LQTDQLLASLQSGFFQLDFLLLKPHVFLIRTPIRQS